MTVNIEVFDRTKKENSDRGQGKNVILSCEIKELRIYDEKNDGFVFESGVYRVYVGNSSAAAMMKEISIIY